MYRGASPRQGPRRGSGSTQPRYLGRARGQAPRALRRLTSLRLLADIAPTTLTEVRGRVGRYLVHHEGMEEGRENQTSHLSHLAHKLLGEIQTQTGKSTESWKAGVSTDGAAEPFSASVLPAGRSFPCSGGEGGIRVCMTHEGGKVRLVPISVFVSTCWGWTVYTPSS